MAFICDLIHVYVCQWVLPVSSLCRSFESMSIYFQKLTMRDNENSTNKGFIKKD